MLKNPDTRALQGHWNLGPPHRSLQQGGAHPPPPGPGWPRALGDTLKTAHLSLWWAKAFLFSFGF